MLVHIFSREVCKMKYLFLVILSLSAIILFVVTVKSRKFFRCFFSSAMQGIAAMFALNALGMVTGLHIAVNWYTIAFSVVFGTPGVIALTVAHFIFSR